MPLALNILELSSVLNLFFNMYLVYLSKTDSCIAIRLIYDISYDDLIYVTSRISLALALPDVESSLV